MKQIGVQFPSKQHLQVSDLVDKTKVDQSKVVRAALAIGLKHLREMSDDALASKILMENARALN